VFLALGCHLVVVGEVRDPAGGPLAGATVVAVDEAGFLPPCEAVSDAAGGFRVHCEPARRRFEVAHPRYLGGGANIALEGRGERILAPFILQPIPLEPGLYLQAGDGFVAPAPAPLSRMGGATEGWRWCLGPGDPPVAPSGPTRLLDNHVSEWRIFRADNEGCVYRLKPSAGGFWSFEAEFVKAERQASLAPGRDWLGLELTAGTYVLADWVAAGFVPEGEGWRATWFRVP
jgi:hypothetical protein